MQPRRRWYGLLDYDGGRKFVRCLEPPGDPPNNVQTILDFAEPAEEPQAWTPLPGKATESTDPDEILPEYDFSGAAPNPYAARYAAGTSTRVFEP